MTAILTWIVAILGGGSALAGIGYLLWNSFTNWENEKIQRENFESQIDAQNKKAQEFANTPAGDDDFHARMRDRINAKRD